MELYVLLGISASIFLVLPFLFFSNSALMLFALCAGELMSSLASSDATNISKSVVPNNAQATDATIAVFLLIMPAVFVLLAYRTPGRKIARFGGVLPGVCATVFAVLLTVPKLPRSLQGRIVDESLYQQLVSYKIICLVFGLLIAMVLLYFDRPRHHSGKHAKSH